MVVKELLSHYKRAKVLDMAKIDRIIVSTKFKKASELIGLLMVTNFVLSLPLCLSVTSNLLMDLSGETTKQRHTSIMSAIAQLCYVINSALSPVICLKKHLDIKRASKKMLKFSLFRKTNRVRPIIYLERNNDQT